THHSTFLLVFFNSERVSFCFLFFSTELKDGLLGFLFLGTKSDFSIRALSFSKHLFLFNSWLRNSSDLMTTSPSEFNLVCNFLTSICFCSSLKYLLFKTDHLNTTAELVLLTFCPPGPPLFVVEKVSSVGSILLIHCIKRAYWP